MADYSAIDNLEAAVAVLNERRWRGNIYWHYLHCPYGLTLLPPVHMYAEDLVAIANSLILAELCAELQAQHAAWLIEKAELTAQVEGLIAERDAWRLAVQKL